MSIWTAVKTWVPRETPKADDLNKQIGGNAQYLKDNKMDKVVTQSQPTRALATPYTFTSGFLLHVLITMLNTSSLVCTATVGGTVVATVGRDDTVAAYLTMSFYVPYGVSYQVDIASGSGTVVHWCETIIG
jgi:hypothetical protein